MLAKEELQDLAKDSVKSTFPWLMPLCDKAEALKLVTQEKDDWTAITDAIGADGKTLEQNYEIMNRAERLLELDLPVLVGVSRKSMIYKLIGGDPTTALNGTTVLHTVSLQKGASILRVHDVKEAFEAIRIVQQLG